MISFINVWRAWQLCEMDLHVQMKMKLMAAMNWLSHRCQVVIMTPVWQKEIAGKSLVFLAYGVGAVLALYMSLKGSSQAYWSQPHSTTRVVQWSQNAMSAMNWLCGGITQAIKDSIMGVSLQSGLLNNKLVLYLKLVHQLNLYKDFICYCED